MTMQRLKGGAELARLLEMGNGKLTISLHDGTIATIKISQKLVLHAHSVACADDTSVPQRPTYAEIRNLLLKYKIAEQMRQRLGLFGRVVLTIKDSKVIHEDWRSGVKID
jgi:hypothetical protein